MYLQIHKNKKKKKNYLIIYVDIVRIFMFAYSK